jgi:hypothetical protein
MAWFPVINVFMLELWCWYAGFYMEICYQENAYQCPYLHCKLA